jgi:hypothetical protein
MKPLKCRQRLGFGARDPSHHRIDEPRIAGLPRISLDQPNRKIDRRMFGDVEK